MYFYAAFAIDTPLIAFAADGNDKPVAGVVCPAPLIFAVFVHPVGWYGEYSCSNTVSFVTKPA